MISIQNRNQYIGQEETNLTLPPPLISVAHWLVRFAKRDLVQGIYAEISMNNSDVRKHFKRKKE